MDCPVDRVENASQPYRSSGKVKRMAETAPEKDRKFTDVLDDEMDQEGRRQHQEETSRNVAPESDQVELSDETKAKIESEKTSNKADPDRTKDNDEMDHVDVKA